MTECKILQLDFYNILSPMVRKVPELKPNDTYHDEGTKEYLDLAIRSKLAGFSDEIDPNDLKHFLEDEPIPLRSMKLPIQGGLSSGWAPNGYGKTYLFSYLDALSTYKARAWKLVHDAQRIFEKFNFIEQYNNQAADEEGFFLGEEYVPNRVAADFYVNEITDYATTDEFVEALRLDWPNLNDLYVEPDLSFFNQFFEKEKINLLKQNPTVNLLPFHVIGALVQKDEQMFAWLYSIQDGSLFIRECHKAETEDEPRIENGWAYCEGQEWHETYYLTDSHYPLTDDSMERTEFENREEMAILSNEILAAINGLEIEYFEVPDVADKRKFSSAIDGLLRQLDLDGPAFLSERYTSTSSLLLSLDPNSSPESSVSDTSLYQTFCEIHDELKIIADPTGLGNDETSKGDRKKIVHSLLESIRTSFPQWQELSEAICDHDPVIWQREFSRIVGVAREMLAQTHGDDFNLEAFHHIRETLRQATLPTNRFNPYDPDRTPLPPGMTYLCDMFDALWLLEIKDELDYSQSFVMNESSQTHARKIVELLHRLTKSKNPFCRFLALKERSLFASAMAESGGFSSADEYQLEVEARHFFNLLEEGLGDDGFPLDQTESPIYEDLLTNGDDFLYAVLDEIAPLVTSAVIHLFLEQELNRCLHPSEFEKNPWGVEVSLTPEESLGGHGEKPNIDFHPAGTERLNTLRPEFLSFGMRSEVLLQLRLFVFLLVDNRSLSQRFLIVDEPEIGRSEYWIQKLNERLLRFEAQLGRSTESGVLVVSHRAEVLENCTTAGQYAIMHRPSDSA